jgi:cytoskeleton protein RodZ
MVAKAPPSGAQAAEAGSGVSQSATSAAFPPASPSEPPASKSSAPPPPATSVLVDVGELAPLPAEFAVILATAQQAAGAGGARPSEPMAEVVLSNPGARVKVVAHMDSWIQIADKAGKSYYAAVLRAGQAIEVPNQPGLLLTAGNAGGLDILVDGEVLPPLGGVGLVKRDLPLDGMGLKSTTNIPH